MMATERDTTLQAILSEAIDLWLRENGKHPFGEQLGQEQKWCPELRVMVWDLPTLMSTGERFAGLDLTDASLDFTDERAVIHWTLPTNLIAKSNSLQIVCVGKVQPSNTLNLLA